MHSIELFVDGSRVGLCDISTADLDLLPPAGDPNGFVLVRTYATLTIRNYDQMAKGTNVKRYKDEKPRW